MRFRWWRENLYRDPEGDTYGFGRFGNHPAVYVSWFDALAFCRWLSQRLRVAVCLPNEWEWQQAAIGGSYEKCFPWGTDWDAKREPYRANTIESRLGQATAVGMYPAGVSTTNILDMSGTVCEWCLNKFEAPGVTRSGVRDFDAPALHGGSWYNNQNYSRSTYRYRSHTDAPDHRSDDLGFRVVCS